METPLREQPLVRVFLAVFALVSGLVLGAGGLFFGFILALVASAALVYGVGIQLTGAWTLVLSLIFVQGVGCIGVALTYYKFRDIVTPHIREIFNLAEGAPSFKISATVPNKRDVAVVVGGYGLALAGAMGGSILLQVFQTATGTEIDTGTNSAAEIGMQNPEVILLLIPASIVLIGPGEELLFRGVVQGRLREVFGRISGVVIPSVIFAGLHWFALSGGSPQGNLVALGILVVPSLVFGAAYEYTGNIVVPSLIHGFYNATLFTLLYVVVAFADQLPQQPGLLF